MHSKTVTIYYHLLPFFPKMSKLVGPFKKKDGKVVRWKKLEITALW
jgi:C4-dicarboxylate transporter